MSKLDAKLEAELDAELKAKSLNESSFTDFQNYHDIHFESEDKNATTQTSVSEEPRPWDAFKCYPLKKKSESMQNNKWLDDSIRVIKLFVYIILFCTVLFSTLITKFIVLFAVSQLKETQSIQFCDYYTDFTEKVEARPSKAGRVIWTWYIIFMFLVPECFRVIYAICYFLLKRKVKMPGKPCIIVLLLLETLHSIGLALLVFYSFPQINSIDAAAISSCVFLIPALLNLFSPNERYTTKMFMLILACNTVTLIIQGSGLFLQSALNYNLSDPLTWVLPLALTLCSSKWWINYIPHYNCLGFTTLKALKSNYHVLEGCMAIWRSLIFITSAIVISMLKDIRIKEFFAFIRQGEYNIEMLSNSEVISNMSVDTSVPLYAFLLQIACTFLTYETAKFAYKTHMHKFGFALPINLITPGTILLIIMLCTIRKQDPCALHSFIPDYLFLREPNYRDLKEFFLTWRLGCWIMWWFSQIWITVQLWLGENERLALTEKIFFNSPYDSLLIEQFVGLNKRRHDCCNIVKDANTTDSLREFEMGGSKDSVSSKQNTCITQIYACATMWHEEKEEMSELIGSILRLDREQCAMKVTQKYYKIAIQDYYELETHIFFDDAFCCMHGCIGACDHNENETKLNQYVATFMETIQEQITNLGILPLPPIKCPTPYGGQLIWNLPGKTRLTVHLKDKNKIRHRKRWSQVMYMYYLLGFRLMGSSIDIETKELIAENTYILTLDGDIDFHPVAVKALLDLMNKDKELGAVCGRIHPVGKGPVVWFQKFEYAIGHWLQKSTEHVTGCVLCSPGCFSLFRAKALMQHNVIAKYATKSTKPRHYIQYDQGEDRWLCTLILQAGCKVEYCAAGDAYTHAPESFNEFYVQRRRWIPSTMANTFDLLTTSKETRKVNENISWLYVVYQWILTGSTVIGPSFIYLMMSGAFVTSFQLDNWSSFWYNLIPIIVFIIVCLFFNVHIQLVVAEAITVIYGLVMIIVLVGIMLQIAEDGYFAPNTLLFFIVISQFIMAACLHPKELSCLPYAIIYYITVPSMYMLLIIFAIFNVHNVTWGTRESKEQQKLAQQNLKTNKSQSEQSNEDTNQVFSLAKFFKCNFCMQKNSEKQEEYLNAIYNSINEINVRLKQLESDQRLAVTTEEATNHKCEEDKPYNERTELPTNSKANTDSESEVSEDLYDDQYQKHSNYLINPYWLQDECIRNGKVDFLPNLEEEFWKQLIGKYLHPIEKDEEREKRIRKGLIHIRNECVIKFFMINTLFVVGIFLLQLNKNILYFQWPFAIEYNITFKEDYSVYVDRNYMHLEPIGCLFIIAFIFILFIQFLAMMTHRISTLTQILANMKINMFCSKPDQNSADELVTNKYAENIVQELQTAVQNDTFNFQRSLTSASQRKKTVQELIENIQITPSISSNFEVLFNRKLQQSNTSGVLPSTSKNIKETKML